MSDDSYRHDAVTVTFNDASKSVEYHPHVHVRALLDKAKAEFGVQSHHLLSLFTNGGLELPDGETAERAGIKPGEVLILRHRHDAVTVTFNGADKVVGYNPHEHVQKVLDKAKAEFGVQSNHLLSLFTHGGLELPDGETAESAGIKPGEVLVLRQSTVKGGRASPLTVPRPVIEETFKQLRECGGGQMECVTYWCGPLDEPQVVDRMVHPLHESGEFGYVVNSDWVTRYFLELRNLEEAIRVQIHTHPEEANHSATDDEFAIAPATGFLSLVIPIFAKGPAELHGAHLVEMQPDGCWLELDVEQAIVIA